MATVQTCRDLDAALAGEADLVAADQAQALVVSSDTPEGA